MLRSWLYVREESGVTCLYPPRLSHSSAAQLTIDTNLPPRGCALVASARRPVSFAAIRRCDKIGILVVAPAQTGDYEVSTSMRGQRVKIKRDCRSDGWQYGLVLQQLVCAFGYAMRRSSWMHVQGPSSAISHAPRTLQMSHVPNNHVCQAP